MIEYRNGRSTAFEVVRLAADLAGAQQRYSQALVRTARAAAALTQLTGGWYQPAAGQE
jgi:outer membrane protein TolC